MLVHTTRFGQVEVDEGRMLTFPKGILGFPGYKRYVLLQPTEDSTFLWLQSLDRPELAFVVADPTLFVPTYRVPLRAEQFEEMGVSHLGQAQVLMIVNKHDQTLTGNLQGPLVINTVARCGEQLVLSDRRYHTRVPLMELAAEVEAMSA